MLLYLIRHGKPDYETDTLLPEGLKQAELVSERLVKSGLDEIYSSPMGRARETAAPTAEKLGLPVTVLPWAYELQGDTHTVIEGTSRSLSWVDPRIYMREPWRSLPEEGFFSHPAVKEYPAVPGGFEKRYRMISEGLDELLLEHGYRRTPEGFYLPERPNDLHLGLFCHNAMMRVMISHLMNIPYQYLCCPIIGNFTGITVFSFQERAGQEGESIVPYLLSYGDVGHIYTDEEALPFTNYSTGKPY